MGRVELRPSESGVISFALKESDLAYWQPGGRFAPPDGGGPVEVHVGPDSGRTRMVVLDYKPSSVLVQQPARVDTARPTP